MRAGWRGTRVAVGGSFFCRPGLAPPFRLANHQRRHLLGRALVVAGADATAVAGVPAEREELRFEKETAFSQFLKHRSSRITLQQALRFVTLPLSAVRGSHFGAKRLGKMSRWLFRPTMPPAVRGRAADEAWPECLQGRMTRVLEKGEQVTVTACRYYAMSQGIALTWH